MQENKYDDEQFFAAYSRFPRSVAGLKAAGEWYALQKMLPDFHGKRVLDIGCGFGWHCIYAAENGASQVVGTDISAKMLAEAKTRTISPVVEYRRLAMEELDYPADSFDVVISSLAFHYTLEFKAVCAKIHKCLTANGDFVFSVEHPVFTASGSQEWFYDAQHNRLHWPVDRYFMEGERQALFLGQNVVKYHRTLTTYLQTLLKTGFVITDFVEPQPAAHLLDSVPEMRDELRRPMMLIMAAKKLADSGRSKFTCARA